MTACGKATPLETAALRPCVGCGLVLRETGGTPPPELSASAACFDRYGELLSRSYSLETYRPVH